MTYKIQQFEPDLGWMNCTRAGETEYAGLRVLAAYRKNWPSGNYRLVEIVERPPIRDVAGNDMERYEAKQEQYRVVEDAMITVKLTARVLQVEDGTWRIVLDGKNFTKDIVSLPDRSFVSREEAIAAIESLEDIKTL